MRHAWATEIQRLAVALLVPTAVGWLAGSASIGLAAGLATYLAWHLYRLAQLARRLSNADKTPLPATSGLWGPVFTAVGKLQSRSRKRKRRLSRFLQRFREAAAALPDAAVILGRGGEVQWMNPAAGELLGLAWPAASDKQLTELVRDPILSEFLEGEIDAEGVVVASPGRKGRLLSVHATPFGKKHQRLLIARDITATYNLDRVRRDFVANVSHELRTPLTVITGFLESFADPASSDAERERSIVLMQDQSARMASLIEDLLTLSRLELNDRPSDLRTVHVAGMLEGIAADARRVSGDAAHVIELDAERDLCIRGIDTELRSAFSNLVINAVQHTPRRTRIRIEWRAADGGAALTVSDDGPGIAARHLSRLTERFYRVDESRSRETGGTGLGLAIVKHVLERHAAELRIESAPGKGARFSCVFPRDAVIARSDGPAGRLAS